MFRRSSLPWWLALSLTLAVGLVASWLSASSEEEPRADFYGDPLPLGARARLGAVCFRPGHAVSAIAFAPDSKTFVAAGAYSPNATLGLWDVGTGKLLRRFEGFAGGHGQVAFALGGRILAVSSGGTLHFLDVATGKRIRKVVGDPHELGAFAVSPDGKALATGGGPYAPAKSNAVRLWDVATGKELRRFDGHATRITALVFTADGRRLVSGSARHLSYKENDGTSGTLFKVVGTAPGSVCLWDLATGKKLHAFEHKHDHLELSPDGKTFAYMDQELRPHVADLATQKDHYKVPVTDGGFAFSPDGKTLATGGRYFMIQLWDVATGKPVRRFQGLERKASQGSDTIVRCFSPDGKLLASAGGRNDGHGTIRLWDVAAAREIRPFGGHEDALLSLAFAPDGKTLATAGRDGTARLWEAGTGKERHVLPGSGEAVPAVVFTADSKALMSLGGKAPICLWDVAAGRLLRRFRGRAEGLGAAARSADGTELVTASLSGVIQTWHIPVAEEIARVTEPWQSLAFVALSPDGRTLAATDRRRRPERVLGAVRLWDTATGKERPAVELHRLPRKDGDSVVCWAAAFSADGRWLATSESHGHSHGVSLVKDSHTLRVWELATGKEVSRLEGQASVVRALAFAPDGRLLAAGHGWGDSQWQLGGGSTTAVVVWDTVTGDKLRTFAGHTDQVLCLAFAPDGKTLASGSEDHTALLWDTSRLLPGARAEPSAKEMETLWGDLAGDGTAAYRAVFRLAAAPRQTVPFLQKRLAALPAPAAARVARLVADLGDRRFAVRQKATNELEKLERLAGPALRKALAADQPLEVRRRVEAMLAKLERVALAPNQLRLLRALAVLERIGSADARGVVWALVDGAPEARLTQEARRVFQRLSPRPVAFP